MSEGIIKAFTAGWFITALVFYVFGSVDKAIFFMVAALCLHQTTRQASHD